MDFFAHLLSLYVKAKPVSGLKPLKVQELTFHSANYSNRNLYRKVNIAFFTIVRYLRSDLRHQIIIPFKFTFLLDVQLRDALPLPVKADAPSAAVQESGPLSQVLDAHFSITELPGNTCGQVSPPPVSSGSTCSCLSNFAKSESRHSRSTTACHNGCTIADLRFVETTHPSLICKLFLSKTVDSSLVDESLIDLCTRKEDETSVMENPQGDVESLRKPLMGDSTSIGGQNSSGTVSKQGPQDVDRKILENTCKPPYQTLNGYSILGKAILAVGVYFAVGIFCCYFAANDLFGHKTNTFIDSFYFCVVTLTTVGYGDLVPGTALGKLFTCLYVFVGFSLVGALVSGAANYIVEMQEKILMRAIKKNTHEDHELSEELEAQNSTWKMFVAGFLVLTLFVVGILFNIFVEKMSLVDSFYCVCVTVTTLGYGDHTFKTATGRLCGSIWILTSTVCVAQFFLYIAEARTESRQLKLAQWVLTRKTTQSDLHAADLDGDGVVSAPEFVLFKLKEMGKVDEDDVSEILKEFHQLDYDRSGAINPDDLRKCQHEG